MFERYKVLSNKLGDRVKPMSKYPYRYQDGWDNTTDTITNTDLQAGICFCWESFVNVQVFKWLHLLHKTLGFPCPHFLIHLKLCTSRLCMKMSSCLYAFACAMPFTLYVFIIGNSISGLDT